MNSLLIAILFLALALPLSARTWTEAASGRTLEGTYVESNATHVKVKTGTRTLDIEIARLSDADREFIREQTAKPAAIGNLATTFTPPVTVKTLRVKGRGEERTAELKATNNGEQAITRLYVSVFLYSEDGSLIKSVPHSRDGNFGDLGKEFGKRRSYEFSMDDFWIKDDVASVAGLVTRITWKDGTRWPAPGDSPLVKQGDAPVSLAIKGIVRDGKLSAPLIGYFNHGDKAVKAVRHSILYLDAEGNEVGKVRRSGYISGKIIMEPGKGFAQVGTRAPPQDAVTAKVTLDEVVFGDDSKWEAPLK